MYDNIRNNRDLPFLLYNINKIALPYKKTGFFSFKMNSKLL